MPAASSTFLRRSENAASICASGDVCHSTVSTRLPSRSRSGSPTKAHSARVRTSISTDPGSRSRRAQTSSTGTSSMWTAAIDSTFVLHSTPTARNAAYPTRPTHARVANYTLAGRKPRKVRKHRSDMTREPRDEILKKPGADTHWNRTENRCLSSSEATGRTVAPNFRVVKGCIVGRACVDNADEDPKNRWKTCESIKAPVNILLTQLRFSTLRNFHPQSGKIVPRYVRDSSFSAWRVLPHERHLHAICKVRRVLSTIKSAT